MHTLLGDLSQLIDCPHRMQADTICPPALGPRSFGIHRLSSSPPGIKQTYTMYVHTTSATSLYEHTASTYSLHASRPPTPSSSHPSNSTLLTLHVLLAIPTHLLVCGVFSQSPALLLVPKCGALQTRLQHPSFRSPTMAVTFQWGS